MDAQSRGILSGIYGRLGDLGAIDERYDCAITTACGCLDHIVVDSVASGEKCLEFLREESIGKGNFICLDKVSAQFKN